jgi:hypothetical protein
MAESEIGEAFLNAQNGIPVRTTLIELGHKQSATLLCMDNSAAFGILNKKAMDMIYHWFTDRVNQKQFDLYWHPGTGNLGDYHTKHHSVQHHKNMRQFILHQANGRTVCKGVLNSGNPSSARMDTHTMQCVLRASQLHTELARAFMDSNRTKNTD